MFNLCDNLSDRDIYELCIVNLSISIVSIIGILVFGLISIYLLIKIKNVCHELLYLHNVRSTFGLLLILIGLFEVAESILSQQHAENFTLQPYGTAGTSLTLTTVILICICLRIIEVRDKPVWLYIIALVEGLYFVLKICKLLKLTDAKEYYDLQPSLVTASALIFLILVIIDGYCVFKERKSSKGIKSSLLVNGNVGYKHPHSVFLSKITFWWLTPLLWKGYWNPLELHDLGNLYEENTSRFQYDQFLFIYQSFKNKKIPLWLCYFKICWKLFIVGGIFKLLGDVSALIGPLSISKIVEYIENMNQTYTNYTTTPSTLLIDGLNFNVTTNNGTLVAQIYYPTWNDFISNGWIISILVLLSSLAQGTLSQGSTHIVNMIGIRLKTAIQGLVYRKSLLISSSCFYEQQNSNNNRDCHHNNSNDDKINVSRELDKKKGINNNNNNNHNHNNDGNKNTATTTSTIDAGTITNLMSEDAFNVMSFFWIAHYVWAIPLKIGVVMYLLYQKLGVSAIIGSLFCIIIMTPLQFLIGKMMSSNGKLASKYTDKRLKKLSEILLGIKIIKLNAWEKVFKEKIFDIRKMELKKLDKDSFYWTAMTILAHVSSILITCVTLTVFICIEKAIDTEYTFTAGRLFSALALFNQLTVPLFIFPITVPIIISAFISTKRLEDFLELPEVKKEFEGVQNMARVLCRSDASLDIFETETNLSQFNTGDIETPNHSNAAENDGDVQKNQSNNASPSRKSSSCSRIKLKKNNQLSINCKLERNRKRARSFNDSKDFLQITLADDLVVAIENGKFTWQNEGKSTNLLQINKIEIPKGKLSIVIGKNGAGKSSLLAALLKEMYLNTGIMIWNKYSTIAYVSQEPWLLHNTIRENILFGESYRPRRYDKVLEACSLKPDIELMPGGDLTEIGERGINLSGGQRQRIAIARALYSSANVVIMDDPLSSLDNEVGNFIIENCIKNMLIRYKRTVILVTQKIHLINIADYIIAMENMMVRSCGVLKQIESTDARLVEDWNRIIAKDSVREIPLSPGRTARERWKLFKNVSRLGLQRTSTSEEDEMSMSSSPNLYIPTIRRASIFGSRHLTCDIPFPIDECHQSEDIELCRRPSKRNNPFNLTIDFPGTKNVLRVNSLQTETKSHERLPVMRNISSPTDLLYGRQLTPDLCDENDTNSFGIRKFLRRLSSRRKVANMGALEAERNRLHRHNSDTDRHKDHIPIQHMLSAASKCSEDMDDDAISNFNEEISDRLISDEERKYGKIPTRIYLMYLKSCGCYVVALFFLSAFGWQALRIYTDVWLRDWTDNQNNNYNVNNDNILYYFKIYGILSGLCILLSFISTPAGQLGGCRARRIIHDKLLEAILKNPLHYFQTTPIGRILNRFSNDMSIIDKKIAATSQRLLQFILLCLCAVLINTTITPWFIVLTIPICIIYYIIQRFYRSSSRELQRIESLTNSPIISHFMESIQGVTTIRAFNQESRFMEILFKRMESNNIAFIILNTSNRWLGIALDYLGGCIVFVAILTALVTSHFYPSSAIPSLTGLAINYTLLIPIYLNWVVKLLTDMEMYVGAMERIHLYMDDSDHRKQVIYKTVPISWPQRGDIHFENISLRYENQKENVINNFSLHIPAGQKIGIVGRTGSGKSSLALSLFGVLNITEGRILIDDVDISTIHVDELRSRLSIIPQDVVLFQGTVRENLDPRGHYTDLELWNCLVTAQLKDVIKTTGLDTELVDGGASMSAGQRQLFSLARAVLRGSACLVLDEATSSLDTITEMELIEAANKAFHGRTIITIAHRLSTILNYDRIIVLEHGKIIEDGDPDVLKNLPDGKFAGMLKSSSRQFC